ncbi:MULTISPECIES: CpaF family protein [unclassified Pseudactinotalea]|uniref:CpaF family protein n=1 Tax=unclassified Pseudactinotalea TaxID=2649176 RepID=UPI00128C37F8|nr:MULTISPECIES: ATPase, T2SS/T4P/T4SS family [unclassified Pseudactinotalea]MPV49889.1 CpaF family protein [Pseudactinotalea sp. HY160]QGH69152.1 CpaF family protein [Pseudactinotalea sp. HY158]
MSTAAQLLEVEVRELIRRRGLDPARDDTRTRELIAEALADYETRSLRGIVPQLPDLTEAAKALHDVVVGFGPLQRYLDDPEIEEIWINEPGLVFVARHGKAELTTTLLTERQVHDLVERMLRSTGRRLDLSTPFVDASLPGGERLHVVIPDVTRRHWAVNIRKYIARADHIRDLVDLGSLTPAAATFLEASVTAGLSILVSGATQAGKTTALNSLAGAIPGGEHVITCEEVFELRPAGRDVVAMQCRQPNLEGTGEIPLRRLVKEALRMRPNRLIIGEVREAEALDLLIALNSGIPGMATVHANSAREALVKMCTLPLLAGENISDRFVVPTVASAIDLIVHLDLDRDGHRRTREILAVTGRVEGSVIETATLFELREGRLARGDGMPPHEERFHRLGYDLADLLQPAPERSWAR